MKRKFLVVLLAIVATFCMAFGFAACGEKSDETGNETGSNPSITDPSGGTQGNQGEQEENKKPIDPNHTHAFSELYYDDIYHWRKCNVCGERYEIVMHTIVANDVCTICGYKMEGYTKGLSYKAITQEDVVGCSVSAGKEIFAGEVVIPAFYGGLPVVSVGSFSDCKELTSVVMPNTVTSIKEVAFFGCSELTSITIPDSVTSIGYSAFKDTAFFNNDSNWDKEGVLYIGNHLIKARDTISGSYSIRGGTKTIGAWAFKDCSGLTSIGIPNSMISIGEEAFKDCSGLTGELKIPSGVTLIGEGAFRYCSGLTGELKIPDSVTSIGGGAYVDCSGLTSITIPDSVTAIEWSTFAGCSGLTSITIPNSVTSIGWEAFKDCSGLTSVTIPNSVTSIGWEAFMNCSGLTSVTIPNSVTLIEGSTFAGCSGLTSITIPDSVTEIGEEAFMNCSGLTSITIPDSVTEIENYAFWGCSGLTSVTIPNSVTLIEIDGGGFGQQGLFYGCTALAEIKVAPNNNIYHSQDNCLIETQSKTLIAGCKTSVIPDDGSVTSIGSWAFSGCSGLTSIKIPVSVTSIGYDAFYKCSGLTSVTIGSGVTKIDDTAFFGCGELQSVIWNAKNCAVAGSDRSPIFKSCTKIKSVTFGENVKTIPAYAFKGCSGLTSVTIGSGVTSIGWCAFEGCSGLTSIIIPDSVTKIEGSAFAGCSGLQSVIWDAENCTEAGSYNGINSDYRIFNGCPNLSSVTFGKKVKTIPNYAFRFCSGLTSITIPDSVTSIGERAFEHCSGLTSVTIGKGVIEIKYAAFGSCTALKEVHFENPNGWKVSKYSDMRNAKDISGLDDPVTAAKYLTDIYDDYYWKREG